MAHAQDTCVYLDNSELCFEIRDDFPRAPQNPDILNQGCTANLSPGPHNVALDGECVMHFTVASLQRMPSPPPAPPPSPPYYYKLDTGPLSSQM